MGGGESKAKVENAQLVACQGCGAISRTHIDAISDLVRFQNVLIDDGRVSMVERWLDRFWCSLQVGLWIKLLNIVIALLAAIVLKRLLAEELPLEFPWQTP